MFYVCVVWSLVFLYWIDVYDFVIVRDFYIYSVIMIIFWIYYIVLLGFNINFFVIFIIYRIMDNWKNL